MEDYAVGKLTKNGLWIGVIFCLGFSASAFAANSKAYKFVAEATEDQKVLITKFPALAQIDSVYQSRLRLQG